jgi:phage/plasmid primase-like uncharacterized protein
MNLFRRENLPQPEAYYTGQGLSLKGSGVERKALCPFHDDHHPSMRVNVETGQFYCHACGAGGDVVKFHMDRHGMTFPNAAKDLGAWAGNGQAENSPDVIAARQKWEHEQAEAKNRREEERAKGQAEAAAISVKIISRAEPVGPFHPYLVKKKIRPTDTLREIHVGQLVHYLDYAPKEDDVPLSGRLLIVPVKVGDAISSLEFIDEQGRKSAVWRGNKTGGYWATQKLPDGDGEGLTLLCGEGMATVTSAAASSGLIGIAALTHTNLARVAAMLRGRYPRAKIIMLGDLGIGEESAKAAAQDVGGYLAVPPRMADVKDFNDFQQAKGGAAVRAALEGARLVAPKAPIEPMANAEPLQDERNPPPKGVRSPERKPAPALDWSKLSGQEPPARRWAIKGWFGFGHTTLLVGPGGIGKTLLAQQAGSCLALGRRFIDDAPEALKVLMWACEDDHDELWRRQLAIGRWLGAGLDAFSENLVIVPRHGLENALVSTEFGRPMFTSLMEELHEQAADLEAQAVILDNAAQLYGGSENDRHAVTMFLNALAGALPGRAVMLLAHPARSAGSEFSGSSAWENTARTRLYLGTKLPDQKADPDEQPDEAVRYLSRRKANYSNRDWRRFTYHDGVLVPEAVEATGGIVGHLRDQATERVVLAGLKRLQETGLSPTDGKTSPRYLPRMILEYKLGDSHSSAELGAAMRRMILDGRLRRATVGKNENRTPIYGLQAGDAQTYAQT